VREREISVSTARERIAIKSMASMLITVGLNKLPEKSSSKKQQKW
jgi:hypothetical protein